MLKPFEKYFGKFTKYLIKIFPFIFNRLTVIVGYIHSDYSSDLIIKQVGDEKNDKLKLSNHNNQSKTIVNKCVKFIKKILKKVFNHSTVSCFKCPWISIIMEEVFRCQI